MVCSKCGSLLSGGICTVCGNDMHRKRPVAIIVMCIVLAVIITGCAAAFFILPSDDVDIGIEAKNFITAAYFADNIVNNPNNYTSYDDFKYDLDIAISSCETIKGGLLDFLTINNSRYNDDVNEFADEFSANMKKDADIALLALSALDASVNNATGADDFQDAVADAKDALQKADETRIVIGSKEVSFSGINTLGNVNAAVFGADIVIGEDVLYFGAQGTTVFYAQSLSSDIAVIDSESAEGAVMETGGISAQLQDGASVAVTYADLDDEPEISVFSAGDKPQFADMITSHTGEFSAAAGNTGANSAGSSTAIHEGGENLSEAFVIGTWQYAPAVINPWKTLSEEQIQAVQQDLEDKKTPGSSLTYADKLHEKYMIFRPDGTGIDYWVVEDVGINQVMGFWWNIDEANGEVVLSFKHSPTDGYLTEWTDDALQDFEDFKNGDYTNFGSSTLFYWQKYYDDLYYSDRSGKTDYCLDYKKVSDSTYFELDNSN